MPAFLGYPGAGLLCINTGHHFISLSSFILMLCFFLQLRRLKNKISVSYHPPPLNFLPAILILFGHIKPEVRFI